MEQNKEQGTVQEVLNDGKAIKSGYSASCIKVEGVWRKTPEFRTWVNMKNRCYYKNSGSYSRYGARGVEVCQRWLIGENGKSGFICFLEDMGKRPQGTTLDRIDNDRGYSPDNCRWADGITQKLNKKAISRLEYNGVSLTVPEWAYLSGMDYRGFWKRLKRGWSLEKSLTTSRQRGELSGE
jgi:hypothetical protein